MRHLHRNAALFVAATSLVLLGFSRPQAADATGAPPVEPERVLASMDWLAGSWSGDQWGGRFVAYYSTPAGGKILSHSKLLKDGGEAFFEFEVFEVRGETVHLAPFPGGSRADEFTLKACDPEVRTAVFENPDKDFPTRITYRRPAGAEGEPDRLEIVLSDPHNPGNQEDRFNLQRD